MSGVNEFDWGWVCLLLKIWAAKTIIQPVPLGLYLGHF